MKGLYKGKWVKIDGVTMTHQEAGNLAAMIITAVMRGKIKNEDR